jgi:hypothetical protein
MLIGLIATFFIPEVKDERGRIKPLEKLADEMDSDP